MDGVEVIYQRTVVYHLDRKSTIRFYLHIFFFDLMDVVVCSNSYIIYNMMHPNGLTLIDFKTIVSTYLIGRYTSRSRAPPDDKTGYNKRYQYQFDQGNLPPQLPEFQQSFNICFKEGIDLKTYVKCTEFGIFSCFIKGRNCFKKHHS